MRFEREGPRWVDPLGKQGHDAICLELLEDDLEEWLRQHPDAPRAAVREHKRVIRERRQMEDKPR